MADVETRFRGKAICGCGDASKDNILGMEAYLWSKGHLKKSPISYNKTLFMD